MKNFLKLIAIAMPAGDSSVNTSLDGEWKSQEGTVISFAGGGSVAKLKDPGKYPAYTGLMGKLKDDKLFMSLKKQGDLKWIGAEATPYNAPPLVKTDLKVEYKSCCITMTKDGKVITVEGPNAKKTYTRK